jgi:hypothetical protein
VLKTTFCISGEFKLELSEKATTLHVAYQYLDTESDGGESLNFSSLA